MLFAALEAKGADAYRADTIAIAGLDGYTRAKTTFKPILPPPVGCLGTWLPTAAYVAANEAVFADGNGVVRSLSVNGQVRVITTVPTSSQQMLSFAVSPDGTRLLASVLTVPRMSSPAATCSASGPGYQGQFTLDVYSAESGANPVLLYHEVVALANRQYPCLMALAGWDQLGPFGLYPACLGPGGGPVHYYGPVVRIDAITGQILKPIQDPKTCRVEDVAADGDFVCSPTPTPSDISVRRPDGSEIWHFTATLNNGGYDYNFLSPDDQHVLARGGAVLGRDGSALKLASTGFFYGWLDSSNVIGSGPGGRLAYATLAAPTNLVDIGFAGDFVGTISG